MISYELQSLTFIKKQIFLSYFKSFCLNPRLYKYVNLKLLILFTSWLMWDI